MRRGITLKNLCGEVVVGTKEKKLVFIALCRRHKNKFLIPFSRGIRVKAPVLVSPHTGGNNMEKWECMVCGYIYDPAKGDPSRGIPPGTPFEALPEDWTCPDCGATKDMFEKV
jgi:rubredoxin